MTTFAGFKYPKKLYQLPEKKGKECLVERAVFRKVTSGYFLPEPRPLTATPEGHPGGSFYLGSDFEPGRYVRRAGEIIDLNHTGWFIDDYQDQKIFGIVIYLPHGRFLAGWSMGEGMASTYDGEIFTDAEEAAYRADALAEQAAENEREYQAEEEEKREAEEQEEENSAADYINRLGFWGKHPDHPVDLWQYEVANDDTRLGYWDWVVAREDRGEDEEE